MARPQLLNAVFVDSQGWMALMNPRDQSHADAKRIYEEIIQKRLHLYTTNWTVYEALSHIRERDKNGGLVAARNLQSLLDRKAVVTTIAVTSEREDRAIKRFWRYEDKTWSVVLCANHEVMWELGLLYVLSANKGYAQAGFVNLL